MNSDDVFVVCQLEDNVLILQIVNLWLDIRGTLSNTQGFYENKY